MPNEFQYSVEDEKKFGVLLDGAKDLIRGYYKSMSKGKINDELKKRDIDDRERIYWEERAPKLLDDLDHKFRDTVWVDWVKNKHTNWLTELLKDSELVDYVPALKELKSFMKKEEKKVVKAAPQLNTKKIKKKNGQTDQKLIMRNYAIIAVAVLLLASAPWFLAVQSSQNNNDELENINNDLASDVDIRVQEIAGLNERISGLVSDNEEREKNSAILQNDMDSKIQELNELNVRLSELASENEERQKVSANADKEVNELQVQIETMRTTINSLREDVARISCLGCKITLNYGTTSVENPLMWEEFSKWNEFSGYISGPFDPQTKYSICINVVDVENFEVDNPKEDETYWLIAKTDTTYEGSFSIDWVNGISRAMYVSSNIDLDDFILSQDRLENNVVELNIDAWICENEQKIMTTYTITYYIKIPDGL